jgi:uncharacterized repeat protein (TIGR02543 family)
MELKDGTVNLTLAHTNGGVQYALLADDGTGKPATTGPAITGIAPGGTAWSYGTGVDLVFAGLSPNTDYYLVARPRGYTEVTYADAAYDEAGKSAAQKITTIAAETADVLAADITRELTGTTISIAASGTKAGYTYAAVNPATGAFFGQPQSYTGEDIKFEGLGSGATYQIVCSLAGSYLPGVRVYPYPTVTLDKDYANSAVGANASGTSSGGADDVPAGVEYTMKASNGTYLIGGENEWAVFSGNERLDLTEQGVVAAGKLGDGSPAMSIFDALDYLNITGRTAATVTYRASVEAGYSGPSVRPTSDVVVSARPAAPAQSDYALDYTAEKLTSNGPLEWAAGGSENWAEFTSGTEKTFSALGWDGAADRVVQLRKKAVTGTLQDEFASKAFPVMIPQRPSAPGGLLAELVNSDDPDAGITISGLADDGAYQYQAGVSGEWKTLAGIASGSVTLDYGANTPEYNIRYSATQASPASFYATVSVLLNAGSVNFGTATYGDDITGQPVTIHNMSSSPITLAQDAVELSGPDAEKFELNAPGEQTVTAKGDNTAWTITPISDIGAKIYHVTVTISYTAGGGPHETSANVYLTVDKADWNMGNIKGNVSGVTENGFTVNVTEGAPEDSKLSFSEASGRWTDPGTAVADGKASHTFTGLNPQSQYRAYVRAQGDDNHNPSAEAKVIAQTVYTAFATPDIGSVLHINYTEETLSFTSGNNPANYTLTANGEPIANYASLSNLAQNGNIALILVRNTDGTYPASAADTATITGKATAPDVTTENASDDIKSDGEILCGGSFQYRVSRNGANVTAGWSGVQMGSVNVTAGRYEVRTPPAADAFASKIASVIVGSNNPTVTAHTKTAAGATPSEPILPTDVRMPSGWRLMSDGVARPGEYDHAYSGAALDLPGISSVTSTDYVFTGWYGESIDGGDGYNTETGVFTGSPVAVAPNNDLDYYAKWAVRPVITGVATDTDSGGEPKAEGSLGEPANTRGGLTADNPVRLDVRLAAGENKLEAGDIELDGQSDSAEAKLYESVTGSGESAELDEEVSGKIEINWGAEPTTLYLKTVSADDDVTPVYYELNVHATRVVSFTAEQTGGTKGMNDDPDVRTSTGIDITFDQTVTGLVDAAAGSGGSGDSGMLNITISDSADTVVKGELKAKDGGEEGKDFTLALTGVTQSGDVSLSIADWAGYTVQNASQGEGENATTRKVAVYRDGTAPTGTISIKNNNFTSFFNWVSFGLFFKATADVTITPADEGGDGVEKTEYLVSQESYEAPDALIAALTSGSLSWTSGTTTSITPGNKNAVYAKITDRAGNILVLNSAGVVVYTDSGADTDTKTINYTKLSGQDQTATVTLNGNTIREIINDNATPDVPGDDVTLEEGADGNYALSNNGIDPETITFKTGYLETLDADDYTLTISYNPLGEEYKANGDPDTNTPPETTEIELNVVKAGSGVITLTMDQLSGVAYGTPITLTATVAKSGSTAPSGTVSFYRSAGTDDLLSTATISGTDANGNGTASITLSDATALDAGTYAAIHAEYAGDPNYAAGSGTLASFTVSQAEQTGLVIKDTDGTFVAAGEAITGSKEITRAKDLTISVSADGGESDGGYTWESDNENAASIAPSGDKNETATITIGTAAENVTITLTKAENNNYEAKSVSFTLKVNEETTPPTISGNRTITPTPPTETTETWGTTLSWNYATDNITDAAKLKYYVYAHASATNDLTTWEACEASDTLLNEGGTDNIATFSVTDLAPDTSYWFNVVVKDEAGNKSAYDAVQLITPLKVSFTAAQVGGADGRAASRGILLTFDKAVAGFASYATVSVAGGAERYGAVQNYDPVTGDDGDSKTRFVPIQVTGDNNATASVTIEGGTWTAADGHTYIVTNTDYTVSGISVYKPVPMPEPAKAAIDFVSERLTGLAEGGLYRFQKGQNGEFGDPVTITDTGDEIEGELKGYWDHIPFSTFNFALGVQRMASPTDPHTNSEVVFLDVPERPTAPEVSVTQPASAGAKGTVTITNVDAGKTYEYCSVSSTGIRSAWTDVADPDQGIGNLDGGRYRIRVKAVASTESVDGSFASDFITATVHAFDEVRFDAQLRGYTLLSSGAGDGSDTSPQEVTLDEGFTITDVVFKTDGVGEGNSAFTISSKDGDWYVQPKPDLTADFDTQTGTVLPHTYHGEITISYKDNNGENPSTTTQDLWFTVHPKAEITSAVARVNSDTGLTDAVIVTFAYATELRPADLRVAGAALRTDAGFTVSDDYKTYTIPVTPKGITAATLDELAQAVWKTGDDIEVWAGITETSAYDVQEAKTGGVVYPPAPTDPEDTREHAWPTVTIPRAITEAHAVSTIAGYSSGVVQFSLSPNTAPIAPTLLMWQREDVTDDYAVSVGAGEIVIEEIDSEGVLVEGSDLSVTIHGVYKVDADEGWTYRVLFTFGPLVPEDSYRVQVSVPGFGVAPFSLGESVLTKTDKAVSSVDYFLGPEGNNFPTDKDTAFQLLPKEEVGGEYAAQQRDFGLSREFTTGLDTSATVYFDGEALIYGTHYEFVGIGPSPFIFDHMVQAPLTDQLALRLLAGWMTENGPHTIHILFRDEIAGDSIVQASVDVSGITPTWPLTMHYGTGGTSAVSSSAHGIPNTETTAGRYEAGQAVQIMAAADADAGYKFGSWTQTVGPDTAITLPDSAEGQITMPAEPVTIQANYIDGKAPVTEINRTDNAWIGTADEITLSATDYDVTKGGANAGTVSKIYYKIDGANDPTQYNDVEGTGAFTLAVGTHTVTFWSVDEAGNIEPAKTVTIHVDGTAPTASVTIRGETYSDFTSASAGYTRFYKGDKPTLTIAADDPGGSDVDTIEYLIDTGDSKSTMTETEAKTDDDVGWQTWTMGTALPGVGTYRVYLRVKDTVGNVTVVRSDGIVYYEDSGPETASAEFTRLGTGDASVMPDITLNGNEIKSVVNTSDDDYALVSGTDYTLDGTTLKLKQGSDYLSGLAASETAYTLTVSYNPRGEDYANATGEGNNAPATTEISLTVGKEASTVTLSADKASGAAVYGEAITLTATVEDSSAAPITSTEGTVEFYDGSTKLGEAEVDTDGTATFTSGALGNGTPLTAGNHAFKAVYVGDDNYAGSKDETTLASYRIEKADQDTLTITSTVTITAGKITATYGDPNITLTAEGGSGDGGYQWTSGNGSIAAVTGTGADATVSLLTVTGSLGVNIYVTKAADADGNYNASNQAAVNLVINQKEVEIKYTPDASKPDTKTYNGSTAATLNGSWQVVGVKPGDENSVGVSVGTGTFADADAGANKPVTCTGFDLTGDKVGSYTLKEQPASLKDQSAGITATVTQRTPTWGAQPTASGIIYGQTVADSTLSDGWTVNGVNGLITGAVDWAASVKTGVPGSDDIDGLNESGYSYTVTFTPSGNDAKNYTTLDGSANIIVGKATPRMAGSTDAKPHGSTIFANPPSSDTLADSIITGDTVFDYGGVAMSTGGGAWEWAVATTETFTNNGQYTRNATFTPDDPRINPLTIDAEFAVYSPKTEVETDPTVAAGIYGMKLKDINFTDNGKVVATSVEPGEASEEITDKGFWAWKNPDSALTSLTGTQTAIVVFTPEDLVDFENPPLSGYVTAETELTITVDPATPALNTSGVTAPVIDEGDALSVLGGIDAALKEAGYTFDGVFSSQTNLAGTFDWDEGADFDPATVVPGGSGYETSRDGNGASHSVKGEGVYYVRVKFTPDSSYGQAYEPVSFAVRIDVALKVIPPYNPPPVDPGDDNVEALNEAITSAAGTVLPALDAYGENYDPIAAAGLREALAEAQAAAGSGNLTQERAGELLAGLNAAKAALVHHHPVIFNSAAGGITGTGTGAEISIKGDYRTVTRVTLNGTDFTVGPANGDEPRALSFEGRNAGTISKGSLVIDLTPEFMDSLPNGDYEVLAHFTDSYLSGDGDATFTINRAADNARWAYEDGSWYLYDAGDQKLTGWQYSGGSWYYLDKTDGIMQTGWLYDGGAWYYLRGNGKMAVNAWVKDNGSWYYLRGNGKMAVNAWVKDGGAWYYLRGNGKMAAQSWVKDGGAWYYLKPSGIMAESVWLRDKSNLYYLKPGGKMAVSERLRIGGTYYRFDGNGVRTAGSTRGVAAR